MMDGKVCNALSGNRSSMKCYICGALPREMNNIQEVLKKTPNKDTFKYGLSTLHAHIRFFECLLHIAYRLDVKKWQVREEEEKNLVTARKQSIINSFREEMGLLVDVVKQGSCTTNDGNTARRFFKNNRKSAEITGIDESLIKRFSVILQCLSCGYQIETERFRSYAIDTANLFVQLYGWYYMPASIHKILIHGADVMDTLLIPIGQLSEEVLEARHKECRSFRQYRTRKISRTKTNEDLLHALLLSSDPVISSLRKLPQRKSHSLPREVVEILKIPEQKIEKLDSGNRINAKVIKSDTNSDSDDDDTFY